MEIQRLNRNQIGILLLAALTGLIHLVLLNIFMLNIMGRIDVLFTLNGLGFLAFIGAFLLPIPFLKSYQGLIRWAFIGYTALTILAWVAMGDKSLPGGALGYFTKLIELALIVLLWLEK